MTGTKLALVGVLASALASPVLGQEGGFQVPLNSGPVIPIPTGRAGEPGFYTTAVFTMGRPQTLPRTVSDLSRLTAGRYGSVIAIELTRPAGRAATPQLYQQLLAIGDPFRGAEESYAKDALLGGFTMR